MYLNKETDMKKIYQFNTYLLLAQFTAVTWAFRDLMTARILGGIHFRTADLDGQVMGIAVARYALDHAFLPCK